MNKWKRKKKLAANIQPLEKQQLTEIKLFCSKEKNTHKLFINKLNYSLLVKVIYIANYSRQEVFNVISTFSTSMILYLHILNDFCA